MSATSAFGLSHDEDATLSGLEYHSAAVPKVAEYSNLGLADATPFGVATDALATARVMIAPVPSEDKRQLTLPARHVPNLISQIATSSIQTPTWSNERQQLTIDPQK